jgi:hypothetical protein
MKWVLPADRRAGRKMELRLDGLVETLLVPKTCYSPSSMCVAVKRRLAACHFNAKPRPFGIRPYFGYVVRKEVSATSSTTGVVGEGGFAMARGLMLKPIHQAPDFTHPVTGNNFPRPINGSLGKYVLINNIVCLL